MNAEHVGVMIGYILQQRGSDEIAEEKGTKSIGIGTADEIDFVADIGPVEWAETGIEIAATADNY